MSNSHKEVEMLRTARSMVQSLRYKKTEFLDYSDFNGKQEKSTVSVPKKATKRLASSIAMYMPATVSVYTNAQYGEVEMVKLVSNVVQNIYKQGVDGGVFNKEFAKKVMTQGGDCRMVQKRSLILY